MHRTVRLSERQHSLALVTASKADNLYWLGRYTERVFTTLNQFFPYRGIFETAGPVLQARHRGSGG